MVIGTSGPKAQAHTVNRSINTTAARSNLRQLAMNGPQVSGSRESAGLTKMEV